MEGSLVCRLPQLFNKLKKHCRTIMKSCQYSQYIDSLEEFTGDVIESVHELQKDGITQVCVEEYEYQFQLKNNLFCEIFIYFCEFHDLCFSCDNIPEFIL